MKMFLIFCLLLSIWSNRLTSGEFTVVDSSESVADKFLTFNINTDVIPSQYHIEIDLDDQLDFQYYNGTSTIRFLSRVDSDVLIFNFNKSAFNEIYAIRLTNIDRNEHIDFDTATYFRYNEEQLIAVELDGLVVQKNHLYDLYVEYMVKFSDEVTTGFYKTCVPFGENGNKSCYVTTHFEAVSFRETVPGFDVIALKSKFNIKITHNSDLIAISNMPVISAQRVGNLTTTQFEETPPMSTYIVAFTVGKFRTIPVENSLNNITMNIYIHHAANAGSTMLEKYSAKLLHSLEAYLNSSYTLPKLDFLVTRTTSKELKGMENWGLITLDENTVLENIAIPSIIHNEEAIEIISHEIAHQVFGNLITMQNITYLWLNEGFATYFSNRLLADVFPKLNLMERIFSRETAITQYIEHKLPVTVINDFQPDAIPNRKMYVYPKGSIIVNLFVHALGECAFQAVMQRFVEKFAYDSVIPDDLVDIIEEVNNIHQTIPSDVNIREFVSSWINQNRFPILHVTRNYTSGDVTISQTSFKADEVEPDQTWCIPFNYATKSKPNFWNTLPDGWLKNESMILPLNLSADDWIIFNKQQSGNYIVNYDEANWQLITEAIIGDNFEMIPPIERARTISDAHYLTHIANTTSPRIFFNLLTVLKKDRTHVVWTVIDRILKVYLTADIAKHVIHNKRDYFMSAYDYLGFEFLDDDSHAKRHTKIIVTHWACQLGYEKCTNDMNKKSEEYLQSIETNQPLVMDQSILQNLFFYGFSRDAAFEQISSYVNNSSNPMLKELFYAASLRYSKRPQFQLHYMLTMYNLTLTSSNSRPAIIYNLNELAKLNEFDMFSACISNNCYDFNGNYEDNDERNQLITMLVHRVIRKVEQNKMAHLKINKLLETIERAY